MRVVIVTGSARRGAGSAGGAVGQMVHRLLDTGHEPLVVPGHGLGRALDRFRPDVVHLAAPLTNGAGGVRAARRRGTPVVVEYPEHVTGRLGRLHRHVTRVLVPSRSAYARLDTLGVRGLHRWAAGVDPELFGPHRRDETLHARWAGRGPWPGGPVVVGYVGPPGVRRLAEVARIPGTRLVVVGDGPGRDRLARRLPGAEVTGTLHGTALAEALASLDVCVVPEAAGASAATARAAQASGVPVVGPATGGLTDVVTDGRTGLLHDPTDPRSLRRAVAVLAADRPLRDRLAGKARARAAGRTWADAVDELVAEHYRPLTGAVVTDLTASPVGPGPSRR